MRVRVRVHMYAYSCTSHYFVLIYISVSLCQARVEVDADSTAQMSSSIANRRVTKSAFREVLRMSPPEPLPCQLVSYFYFLRYLK